jgi:hypothetical protein
MSQGGSTHLLAHNVHLEKHQDFVQFRKENDRYQSMRHVQRETGCLSVLLCADRKTAVMISLWA